MPEQDSGGLFYKPFMILAAVVAVTALVGIFYLLGAVIFNRLGAESKQASKMGGEEELVWASRRLSKCNESWHSKGTTFDKYVKSLGVEVLEKKVVADDLAKIIDCSGCECPSGEVVFVKVYNYALADLVGFVKSGPPKEK